MFIGDKDWKPEYPVIAWKNGIMIEEDGYYIRDYPLTERVCKKCGKSFTRAEYPPIFKYNMDAILGKDVCLDCGYAFLERSLYKLTDSRRYDEFFASLR